MGLLEDFLCKLVSRVDEWRRLDWNTRVLMVKYGSRSRVGPDCGVGSYGKGNIYLQMEGEDLFAVDFRRGMESLIFRGTSVVNLNNGRTAIV